MTPEPDPAGPLIAAVHAGDLSDLARLLAANPGLASGLVAGRTPLHVVTDWPGYFPNGPQVVRMLIDAGADPNVRPAPDDETPLQWAASSDDVDVAAALIDGGADVNKPDEGSIGSPLANAVGYGCWHVARLLVDRGARVDAAWLAAAMGMLDRLTELVGDEPDPEKVSQAFWHACAAGQRRAAEYLLQRGADLNWEPDYAHGTPLDAARGQSTRQENVISWLQGLGARSADTDTPPA